MRYFVSFSILAGLAASLPIPRSQPSTRDALDPRAPVTAAAYLLTVAPTSKSCDGGIAVECRTNVQAAQPVLDSLAKYKIYQPAEIAALVSLMALESGEFKYNINHFPEPGRPGQGTRNMQMPQYNLEYAQSVLPADVAKITSSTTANGLSDDDLNAIRALVLPDKYSFASAAWFYATKCAPEVRTSVAKEGKAGYVRYLTECVGTAATDDRLAYWKTAREGFGLSTD
ncbi:hypothetical protein B0O99DRAFT_515270 [Bisporella sp. PMI_857]|nr:hypothetical protein B0O99DRAFT_515270 [Bisporella sp. PMI_857]